MIDAVHLDDDLNGICPSCHAAKVSACNADTSFETVPCGPPPPPTPPPPPPPCIAHGQRGECKKTNDCATHSYSYQADVVTGCLELPADVRCCVFAANTNTPQPRPKPGSVRARACDDVEHSTCAHAEHCAEAAARSGSRAGAGECKQVLGLRRVWCVHTVDSLQDCDDARLLSQRSRRCALLHGARGQPAAGHAGQRLADDRGRLHRVEA
jgi:hypothetical protein